MLAGMTAFAVAAAAAAEQSTIYVSANGSDAWSGSLAAPNDEGTDGPVATLERARDVVRQLKKTDAGQGTIVVEVGAGTYELSEPLSLTAEDGGASADAPVIWRAKAGDSVKISAGKFLTDVKPLTDSDVLSVLKEDVRDKVCVVDLSSQNVGDLGTAADGPELFFNGEPTRVARYPDSGFVRIVGLSQKDTHEVDIRGTKGIAEGQIIFDDKEILHCSQEKDLWVNGYWFWDWCQQTHKVESIDAEAMQLNVEGPYHEYGYRIGQWFYLFNALCELDAPGEYYIDREAQKLYFYPTTADWVNGSFLLTKLHHVLRMDSVSNFVWEGFQMCGSRQDAVSGSSLNNVAIRECDVFDVGGCGIALTGLDVSVEGCELWYLSRAGINVTGGDRTNLTPSGNKVVDNYVHDYALVQRVYQPGVSVYGVGNYAGHNLIENAPHMGMGFGGNENILEFNEIGNVCTESNDAGAIYTGRNWTMRGNILRNNYLHDIQGFENNGCVGIYLDDMFSSADIVGNLFVNVTRAAFIGGGRDSKINGNLFVNCNPALHIDARGAGWAKGQVDAWIREGEKDGTLSGVKYKEAPYATRYPELAKILDDPESSHYPEGNEVIGNVCVGGFWDVNKHGQWQGATIEAEARPLLKMENNYVTESDDGSFFVDAANGDYRLKEDSAPAREGHASLPVAEMGLTSERMKAKAKAWRSR